MHIDCTNSTTPGVGFFFDMFRFEEAEGRKKRRKKKKKEKEHL